MSSIKDVPMVMVPLSYISRRGASRTDVRSDSHVTIRIFLARWVTKFSQVWGFARAPLARRSLAITSIKQLDFVN